MMNEQPVTEFEGGSGGKIVIKGSLDITLADGTVEKRPFVIDNPQLVAKLMEEAPNG